MTNYKETTLRDRGNLCQGVINGKPAWTNGFTMEIGRESPFRRIKGVRWTPKDFQFIVDESVRHYPIIATAGEEIDRDGCGENLIPLYIGDRKTAEICLNDYLYFTAQYRDATFCLPEESHSYSPVQVFSLGELVGLIMPVVRR